MSEPVKISRAQMQAIGGVIVANTAAPGTGFNPIIHSSPMPVDLRVALEAEEVEWGYSEEYRELAKAARAKLWPVWYSRTGLTIGGAPTIDHGVAPVDLLVPKLLHVNKSSDYVGELLRYAAVDLAPIEYPWLPGWEGRCFAAATPALVTRFDQAAAQRTARFFLGYSPAAEDIVYCEYSPPRAELIEGYAMDGSGYEQNILPALMSRKGPSFFTMVALFPGNATFILQVRNVPGSVMTKGLMLYCTRWLKDAPSLTLGGPIVGTVVTSNVMTDGYGFPEDPAIFNPDAQWSTTYGRGVLRHETVLTDVLATPYTSWDVTDNRHGQGLEWITYGPHLVNGTWASFGELNVTKAHVFGVPPLIKSMHVMGDTVRASSTTLSIHQDLVAFDWLGGDLEKIQPDMTEADRASLGKLDVRTVYNLRSQWTVPNNPLLALNLYQTAKANDVDIAGDVLVPADSAKGTPAITFRKASERASLQQYRILHHFRNLVSPDQVSKIRYTGNAGDGYMGALFDSTGSSIPWDQNLAILAFRKGCAEDFTLATGQGEDAIRYELLGVGPEVATMAIDGLSSGKGDNGDPEMVEDLFFDHGSIPNPTSDTPLNMRAAIGLRFFSPSRSSFDGITNGLFAVTMHQMARLTA